MRGAESREGVLTEVRKTSCATIVIRLARLCLCVGWVLGLSVVTTDAVHAQRSKTAAPTALPPASEDSAPAETKRLVIRFLTESDFPPFNFYDEEGGVVGFNVDLARALCAELTVACEIKVRPWKDLFPALRRGEADAVIAGHAVTESSLALVDFTDRYFQIPARFFGRRDGPKVEMTPESLDGYRIGVIRATAHEAYLRALFPDASIQAFASADLAREALVGGKVDFLFDDAVSSGFWLNGTNSNQCCEFKGGAFLEPRYFGDGMAIAVPKTDPQIRRMLNEALKKIRETKRMEELVQRYFSFGLY